jgi:hypothetical protein
MEASVTVPLYSYDSVFMGLARERNVLRLERDGLAKVIRHKKGRIARAVMYKRPGDPMPTTVRDYMGKAYSFRHHLDDGHQPWSLKAEAAWGPQQARPERRISSGSGVRAADLPACPAGLPCAIDVNKL